MDKVTYVKTKFRQDQWERLITDCQNSCLKVDEWCAENHISRHAYYYWLRKIRKKACETMFPALPKEDPPVTFAKVEIKAPQPNPMASVIIHLPSATLEIHNGTEQQTIEAVLLALKNIC